MEGTDIEFQQTSHELKRVPAHIPTTVSPITDLLSTPINRIERLLFRRLNDPKALPARIKTLNDGKKGHAQHSEGAIEKLASSEIVDGSIESIASQMKHVKFDLPDEPAELSFGSLPTEAEISLTDAEYETVCKWIFQLRDFNYVEEARESEITGKLKLVWIVIENGLLSGRAWKEFAAGHQDLAANVEDKIRDFFNYFNENKLHLWLAGQPPVKYFDRRHYEPDFLYEWKPYSSSSSTKKRTSGSERVCLSTAIQEANAVLLEMSD